MTKKQYGLHFSIFLHALILVFAIVKVRFFAPQILELSQAIRVDVVGLPDKYTQEQISQAALNENAPIAKNSQLKEVENKTDELDEKKEDHSLKHLADKNKIDLAKKNEETLNLDKSKLKQKAALDKLKQLNALDKIKNSLKQDQSNLSSSNKNQNPSRVLIKGRIISKGTSLTGIDKLQSDDYLLKIDAKIKQHWQLPGFLINKPFKTKILLKLNSDGTILSKKVYASSGNTTYDDFCLAAVEKASPFSKVPEKFTEIFSDDGLLIGFPE